MGTKNHILILAENLNLGRSYLITAVLGMYGTYYVRYLIWQLIRL